jgi:hypothetical protein
MLPAEWKLRWPNAPVARSRNGVAYLTVRRFSAQDRLNAVRAVKRLEAEASDRETGLEAAEIALLWSWLTGGPGGWTVTNIEAGHSGGNSFGARLAIAVAERLSLGTCKYGAAQRRLASEGIPAFAAARHAGQADRREPRN